MIGVDNQAAAFAFIWLERALLAGGGLGLLALVTVRFTAGEALPYPQSLLWVGPCALLAVGCALLYWRVTTRMPQ